MPRLISQTTQAGTLCVPKIASMQLKRIASPRERRKTAQLTVVRRVAGSTAAEPGGSATPWRPRSRYPAARVHRGYVDTPTRDSQVAMPPSAPHLAGQQPEPTQPCAAQQAILQLQPDPFRSHYVLALPMAFKKLATMMEQRPSRAPMHRANRVIDNIGRSDQCPPISTPNGKRPRPRRSDTQ